MYEDDEDDYREQLFPGVRATEMLKQEDWDSKTNERTDSASITNGINDVIEATNSSKEGIEPRPEVDNGNASGQAPNMPHKVRRERNMKFV